MKKLLILTLFAASCGSITIKEDVISIKSINYYRDCRTGLCFAEIEKHKNAVAGHACVPCERVESFLKPCDQ